MKFRTIKQTAKELGIPEHFIRQQVKRGEMPGFYSETRFYVNVEALEAKLASAGIKDGEAK